MAIRKLPPQEVLRQLLEYDPDTGKLFWRERPESLFTKGKRFKPSTQSKQWNTRYAGKEAMTSVGAGGYLKGTIDGVYYLAHRVIWKLVTGIDPDEIDHIDGGRANNRFDNLRDVNRGQNAKNIATPRTNTSGVMGVYSVSKSWTASIRANGLQIHLGTFDTMEEALEARKAAEVAYGYHENHGREAAT